MSEFFLTICGSWKKKRDQLERFLLGDVSGLKNLHCRRKKYVISWLVHKEQQNIYHFTCPGHRENHGYYCLISIFMPNILVIYKIESINIHSMGIPRTFFSPIHIHVWSQLCMLENVNILFQRMHKCCNNANMLHFLFQLALGVCILHRELV